MKKKDSDTFRESALSDPDSDTELIFRIKEGDRDALGELVDTYQKRILSVAYRITGDWHAAQDLSQEVFITLMEKMDTFDPERSFFSWVYRVAVNRSIDYLRSRTREKAAGNRGSVRASVAETPEQAMIRTEKKEKVQKTLARIPFQYRTILVLRDIEGLSTSRIADILDLIPATARWRIFQARKLFREAWDREGA